jgi:hypothetical protein
LDCIATESQHISKINYGKKTGFSSRISSNDSGRKHYVLPNYNYYRRDTRGVIKKMEINPGDKL